MSSVIGEVGVCAGSTPPPTPSVILHPSVRFPDQYWSDRPVTERPKPTVPSAPHNLHSSAVVLYCV